jgi:biotin-(acetyl-CoA carboxylase) ligase
MPLETRARALTGELILPPPFTLVRLRELGDAFAHAKSIAAARGAGTMVYVGRFDLAEFAMVLEPEEPLAQARRVLYAGMAALADALTAQAQPETSLAILWPDAITINLGMVGGVRLAWPHGVAEDETPPWLVFGAMIRTVSMTGAEPGANPQVTALSEEGFDMVSDQLLGSFARHFMVAIDAWQERGFDSVARSYLERLPGEPGLRYSIDDNGDLLLRRKGDLTIERKPLLERLAKPAWFDAAAKEPLA